MNKQRLLILYDYFDPAYKAGGPIRSLVNLVGHLEHELEIYVLTGNRDHDGSLLEVEADAWIRYGEKANVMYLSEGNRSYRIIKEVINEVSPDVVYLNGMYSFSFLVFPLLALKNIKVDKVIIAPRGMLQQGALKIKSHKKKIYLTLLRFLLPRKNLITWHATDEQEKKDIRTYLSKSNIQLAGNVPVFEKQWKANVKKRYHFVSISLLERKKDHLSFIRALNELSIENGIEYHIYGPKSDEQYYKELSEAASKLPENINVVLKGAIHPSEVSQTLSSYKYYVLTSFGENFGHSIFEAFNNGVPVIICDQTPWKGLVHKHAGWDVDVNDEKSLMSAIEQAITMDEPTYQAYQIGARKIAEDYIIENDFKAQYLRLFS